MFIENTQANTRALGEYLFHGGLTKVEKKEFNAHLKKEHLKVPFDKLVEEGVLIVLDDSPKLTKAMIEKTFDLDLLSEYEGYEGLNGVLKGALKKQRELLALPEEKEVK